MFATAAGPYFILILGFYNEWIKFSLRRRWTSAFRIGERIADKLLLAIVGLLLYMISRISLFVLVLYSLSSMPFGGYVTIDWTNYFPFLSQILLFILSKVRGCFKDVLYKVLRLKKLGI